MATTRIRRLTALHVLLLGAQLLASGAVSAHAREPLDAPSRIESAQHEHCPVLHDAAVCVLCALSHHRVGVPPAGGVTLALPAANPIQLAAVTAPRAVLMPRSGNARAPPHSQG